MEPFPYRFGFERRDWPRRVAAVLAWLGIVEAAQALVAGLQAGLTTNLILTIGSVLIASAIADRVAGVAIVPAPSLLALVGLGLVVGVLCGHAIAARYALGATAAEICMIGGATVIESVLVATYRVICVAGAQDARLSSNVMLRTAQR